MATHRLLFPTLGLVGASFGAYTAFTSLPPLHTSPLLHSAFPSTLHHADYTSSFLPFIPWARRTTPSKPMAPPPPQDLRGFSPIVYRQVSTGSFLGVALGLLVSRFGKVFAIIAGAGLVLVEVLARQGIEVIPWDKVKGWVDEVEVRRMVTENMAFKIAFCASFGIAVFFA
ncbi:hypothetical protein EX30DRAFT_317432 [Ascodesmis nigricans]|uniref:FUN14-domain-containing protein n=1 Tax=Ascodesmis nigricans TaxID=341454 RepID=A0A4S2N2H6_9PEZI|nr:hypothetical protein EX30DRAFT_317432 [Ascodesmis nigricans]